MRMLEYHGVPIGHIRFDRIAPYTAQLSYMVAPGYRGKGVGTQLLERTRAPACYQLGVQRLQGITFTANRASVRAFQKAGYQLVREEWIDNHACLVFCWACA